MSTSIAENTIDSNEFFENVKKGHIEPLLEMHLLTPNLDLNIRNKTGSTALHLLSRTPPETPGNEILSPLYDEPFGAPKVAFELLRLGAEVDVFDEEEERTPLHWAALNGDIHLIELFLHYKADITARDRNGNNILHLVAKSGNLIALALVMGRTFIEARSLFEARNKFKQTFNQLFKTSKQVHLLNRFKAIHNLSNSRRKRFHNSLLLQDLKKEIEMDIWDLYHALIAMKDITLLKQNKTLFEKYNCLNNSRYLPSKIPSNISKYIPSFNKELKGHYLRFKFFDWPPYRPLSFQTYYRFAVPMSIFLGEKNDFLVKWFSIADDVFASTRFHSYCNFFHYACTMTDDSFVEFLLGYLSVSQTFTKSLKNPVEILKRYRPNLLHFATRKLQYYMYRTTHDSELHETCPICREPTKMKESWIKLSCSHQFHAECIRDWIHVQNSCPMCRRQMAPSIRIIISKK